MKSEPLEILVYFNKILELSSSINLFFCHEFRSVDALAKQEE